jgi:hypothetical protein
MEKQTKNILLVVGGAAVLYLIYKLMKGKEAPATDVESVVDGVIDRPFPIVKYRFIQPHSVEWFSSPTSKGTKTFQIGDVVETKRQSGGTLVTYTSLDGTAPDFEMIGTVWLEIPIDKLEEVSTTTNFTGIDNFFKGHSQNCSGLNCA